MFRSEARQFIVFDVLSGKRRCVQYELCSAPNGTERFIGTESAAL